MEDLSSQLIAVVNDAQDKLLDLSEEAVSLKPNPDKWSKKEILGHLIDSAANNHVRFMIGQSKNDLIFNGYAQDQWVEYQDYQHANWKDLVDLFIAYNKHMSRVIAHIPKGVLRRELTEHNLHLLAFKRVPQGEPTSLAYFIQDYIDHIVHHLKQIFG